MKEAIRLAKRGLGKTSPNPMVGAVVVRDGKIISKGYHRRAGEEHAEVAAIKGVKGGIKSGDILYVTLEPCNHWGRTPPCTELILRSGIKRVVVGMRDPNPNVRGGGIERLRENGVEVIVGVLEEECERLNEAYIKYVTTGIPYVISKTAITLDGFIATGSGDSKWISNELSRRYVQRLRYMVDAVMVGIGTVLKDNPLLNIRYRKDKEIVRVILDTHLSIPKDCRIMNTPYPTIIFTGEDTPSSLIEEREREHVRIYKIPLLEGLLDIREVLKRLGELSITSLLLEGGSRLLGSFFKYGLIDKCYIFLAPKLLGGSDGIPLAQGRGARYINDCIILKGITIKRFDDDILIVGYPQYRG